MRNVIYIVSLGALADLIGFFILSSAGAPFWSASSTYAVIGMTTILLAALASLTLGRPASRQATAPQTATPPRPAPAAEDAESQGMRILAVDDDSFILELIPRIAAMAGFPSVTTAPSAAAALDMILTAKRPFDCLLLDINMPGIDGIDLCARIRRMAAYSDAPIIMLTAMTEHEYLNRAFRAGASDYTTKPFDIIDFRDRLQIAAGRVAAQRAESEVATRAATRLAPLPEVPALIDPGALASYVARLSGPALNSAFVMAVAVDGPGKPLLIEAAKAIDGVFGLTRYVFALVGEGQFILVANGSVTPDPDAVRTDLVQRLTAGPPAADAPRPKVRVGPAVRLQNARGDRAQVAFDSALALMAQRGADGARGVR